MMSKPTLYTKPELAPRSREEIVKLIRATVFGTLVTATPHGFAITHTVFELVVDETPHGTLLFHLASKNEHVLFLAEGLPSVAIFLGQSGYISPSWYPCNPARESAPTWNYEVAHCHGRPERITKEAMASHVGRLVNEMESGRTDRWRMGELGPKGSVGGWIVLRDSAMPIAQLDAKFKMGQDERPADTAAAIRELTSGNPHLADAMRERNHD
jgi:transcriptional regulator